MKKIKLNWMELFKGLELDYLLKDEHEMDTSLCCLHMGRDKVITELNKRLNKQLKILTTK